MMRIRLFSAIAIALATSAAPAMAQQSAPAADPCAVMAGHSLRDVAPLLDTMLTPGKTFDLSKADPALLAKFTAYQAADAERAKRDWSNLCKYRADNAALKVAGTRTDVVMLGDSITEFWQFADPAFFRAGIVDRGISGQTTPQILLRFYQDVVALYPRVVHIMAGTNDITGNTGPVSDDTVVDNFKAMIDIAKANGITVVLASLTPRRIDGSAKTDALALRVIALNRRLSVLAGAEGLAFVDYHARMRDAKGGMPGTLANDGLHPNRAGYVVMRPLTDAAISRALKTR